MPIIRNPFRKQDENVRPANATNGGDHKSNGTVSTKPVDILEKQPTEYQLSEINDSGVYLPPSPPERKPFWLTNSSRSTTTTSSTHRSVFNENEQFNISRESFDSYRRSFDISARSPVVGAQDSSRPPRASLDSRSFQPLPPRSSNSFHRPLQVPVQTTEEAAADAFEDVDIGADAVRPLQQQQKKRGLFSRFADSGSNDHVERPVSSGGDGGSKSSSWHHFGGRKRGQSGQGSELGSIPNRETTPKPESSLRKEQATTTQSQLQPPVPKAQVIGTAAAAAASPASKSVVAAEPPKAQEEEQQATVAAAPAVQEVQEGLKKVDLQAPTTTTTTKVNGDRTEAPTPAAAPQPANSQAPVDVAKKVGS